MIVYFDIESTGVDTTTAKIVSLCCIKVDKDGNSDQKYIVVNPEVEIPQISIDVHGITNEEVKDKPTFKQYAKGIHKFIDGCILGGHNILNYDMALLYEEFKRAGIEWDWKGHKVADTQQMEWLVNKRSLEACYERYTGKKLEGSHNAVNDVKATIEVLKGQSEKYGIKDIEHFCEYSLQETQPSLDVHRKILINEYGELYFPFGKYKGETVQSVYQKDIGYMNWFTKTFPDLVKLINEYLKV